MTFIINASKAASITPEIGQYQLAEVCARMGVIK
jgi:hypothetical protein